VLALALGVGVGVAQFRQGGPRSFSGEGPGRYIRGEGGTIIDEETVRTAREADSHSTGTPNWTNSAGFGKDVFTFTRVLFKSGVSTGSGIGGDGGWAGGWIIRTPT